MTPALPPDQKETNRVQNGPGAAEIRPDGPAVRSAVLGVWMLLGPLDTSMQYNGTGHFTPKAS